MTNKNNTTNDKEHDDWAKCREWANSPVFLLRRVVILIFGAIAILGFAYLALKVLQLISVYSVTDTKFLSEYKIIHLTDLAVASAGIAAVVATIWALQLYWRLRYIDKQTEKWRPKKNKDEDEDEWSNPFTRCSSF